MLTVERISEVSALDDLQVDWDRLAGNHRMRSSQWARAWWQSFPHRCIPYVLMVRDRQGVQGLFPLALENTALRGRRLILIGSGKACGDNLGILAAAGLEKHVACSLADWLVEANGANSWDSLDLDGVQPSDTTMQAFQKQFESVHQIPVTQKASESCWAIDLRSGWDGFLHGLSKRTRRMVQNEILGSYLETGRARLRVAESKTEAQVMLKKIAIFHQSRWSERSIDGCFGTKGFDVFLETLLDCWWESGIAYVAMVELDGVPVAGGIGMWSSDELSLYLVGMDVHAKESRPGWIFNVESIRTAIQAGVPSFNFLRGDEEYKGRLGAEPTIQQRWLAVSPRLVPRLRSAALQKGIEVRDWFRNRAANAVDPDATSQPLVDANT
jgi:CelD/BcsL family acetyltransferase involved in cellulose biosynthesis